MFLPYYIKTVKKKLLPLLFNIILALNAWSGMTWSYATESELEVCTELEVIEKFKNEIPLRLNPHNKVGKYLGIESFLLNGLKLLSSPQHVRLIDHEKGVQSYHFTFLKTGPPSLLA